MSNIMVRAILASMVLVIALLALSGVYPGIVSELQAQGPPCSLRTLQGSYGNSFQFLNLPPGSPVPATIGAGTHLPGAGITVYVFDGQGNFSGPSVVSIGGLIVHDTVSGTYTVDSNCMGSMEVTFSGGASGPLEFVVVDDGNEIHTLGTSQGDIAVGTMKKQFSGKR